MASSSSAKAGERILPLAALDFSSGVFGIDPLVRRRAGEGAAEVTLEDEMRHHGVFFDQLLTMIPAQYYLKDEEAAEEQWKSRFWRVSASLRGLRCCNWLPTRVAAAPWPGGTTASVYRAVLPCLSPWGGGAGILRRLVARTCRGRPLLLATG